MNLPSGFPPELAQSISPEDFIGICLALIADRLGISRDEILKGVKHVIEVRAEFDEEDRPH